MAILDHKVFGTQEISPLPIAAHLQEKGGGKGESLMHSRKSPFYLGDESCSILLQLALAEFVKCSLFQRFAVLSGSGALQALSVKAFGF